MTKLADLIVLIPSHSLEDFPTSLPEDQAASLLNAFQILWDPRLLAAAGSFPSWNRADEPPQMVKGRLIVVPTGCAPLLPAGWIARAIQSGVIVVHGQSERQAMLEMALAGLERLDGEGEEAHGPRPVGLEESSGVPEHRPVGVEEDALRLSAHSPVAAQLSVDFFALAFCYLQLQLLARHMRHFSYLDETHFQRETLEAAKAAVGGDAAMAMRHLRNCFEVLTEARQRFYPVDAYLIDLGLMIPSMSGKLAEDLKARVGISTHQPDIGAIEQGSGVGGQGSGSGAASSEEGERNPAAREADGLQPVGLQGGIDTSAPLNLLMPARTVEQIAEKEPALLPQLRLAVEQGWLEVCGGEYDEVDSALLPLESLLWQFEHGAQAYRRHLGRAPRVFARRRYGLMTQLPLILARHGYQGAVHLALDDGKFPSPEQAKIRWEGSDGSVVDALAQIPLPADDPVTYLKLPQRLAQTMDRDHVATLVLAHWPGVKAPWYQDLRRMAWYSPALGRFVSVTEYFQRTDSPGRLSKFGPDEYRSPYLEQAVARGETDPISRYGNHEERRRRLEEAWWMATAAAAVISRAAAPSCSGLEMELERAAPATGSRPAQESSPEEAESGLRAPENLAAFHAQSAQRLSGAILRGAATQHGYLVLNPLSFSRRAGVELPGPLGSEDVNSVKSQAAAGQPAVLAAQAADERCRAVVEVPAMGYTWLPSGAAAKAPAKSRTPMAERNVLRNESIEVYVDQETGGLRGVLDFRRSTNHLGMQLAFRLPRAKSSAQAGHSGGAFAREEEHGVRYSRMVCEQLEVTSAGPALGEIVTRGYLADADSKERLANFEQRFRVWRGRPVLEIDITLEPRCEPGKEPWDSYYAARFAWSDEEARLVRGVQLGAHTSEARRLESPHYVEIASGKARTAILTAGLPFHQRHGDRMLDTLLVVAGERRRRFRLGVAVDCASPLQAAFDFAGDPIVLATDSGPPLAGKTGWLFFLEARNVVVTSIRPLEASRRVSESASRHDADAAAPQHDGAAGAKAGPPMEHVAGLPDPGSPMGFRMRLVETEGRAVRTKLRLWRNPTTARLVDLQGKSLAELVVQDDAVVIDLTGYEIATLEVRFA